MNELIATKRVNELISISRILILMTLVIQLSGCGGHVYHVVEPGETLYSIGWLYGYDYRQIAQWNNITPPYALRKGQRLRVAPVRLSSRSSYTSSRSATSSKHQDGNKIDKQSKHKQTQGRRPRTQTSSRHTHKKLAWLWPLKGGKVIQTFNASDPGKRGLDVIGYDGQPIYAAAQGRVVYSGGGIPRYGKLLIVKHNDEYLSAYAHNKRLRVKEGENLRAGQHIADMGRNNANKILLHFEIRRNGKPVDPLKFLPTRK